MGADVSPATRHELAPQALHALLREVFGYTQFRGPQADIIGHVSQGGDALVLMPTGGGKSLCYQIPAIARQRAGLGVAVVVSPLIALMHDQVGALHEAGALSKARLSALTDAELDAALTLGTRSAAITVSRAGANPPWRSEL